MSASQQLHAVVRGRVQGVSFRYHTTQTAKHIGCTGWVRNNPDGTVTCVAQGTDDQLQQMIEFLHTGSPAAQVEGVDVRYEPAETSYTDFTIRH